MPRAAPGLQQVRVFAEEADSGPLCDRPFQQWDSIDKAAIFEFAAPCMVTGAVLGKDPLYVAGELYKAGLDNFVIVATPGIPGNAAIAVHVLEGRRNGVVIDRERYDG